MQETLCSQDGYAGSPTSAGVGHRDFGGPLSSAGDLPGTPVTRHGPCMPTGECNMAKALVTLAGAKFLFKWDKVI